jgi:hypothetical protein
MSDQRENTTTWEELLNKTGAPPLSGSWKAMEGLLDKDMPAATRRRGWPWLLLLLLLLLIGVCNYYRAGIMLSGKGKRGVGAHVAETSAAHTTGAPATSAHGAATSAGTPGNSPAAPTKQTETREAQPLADVNGRSSVAAGKNGSATEGDVRRGHMVVGRRGAKANNANASTSGGNNDTGDAPGMTAGGSAARDTAASGTAARGAASTPAMGTPATDTTATDTTATMKKPATAKPSNASTAKKPASKAKKDPWPPYKGFTAGFGFNQFFPVGQQVNANFNSSGNNGTITDYLPVPEVRYYFSKRLYVQAEAQVNTPQYTSKNLLAAQQVDVNSASGTPVTTTNSVYIKKLFYFNLPVSIHYSPVWGLSLGAGLEYARLTNGVADHQQRVSYGAAGPTDSVRYSKVQSFKGDSVYQKLRTSEWRLLGEVSYQWHGFTLGARYNWATDKFIHVQVSSTQLTQSRNTSLQLYLRYTIWKEPYPRKKKK